MLTPKQAAFVREYLIDRNATQAAIRAGYSADTAKQQGSRLLTYADVQRAVEAKEQRLQQKADVTIESIAKELDDARDMAAKVGQPAAMVSAAMGKAKLYGLIIDKSQNENRSVIVNELDDATLTHIASGSGAGVAKPKGGEEEPTRVH